VDALDHGSAAEAVLPVLEADLELHHGVERLRRVGAKEEAAGAQLGVLRPHVVEGRAGQLQLQRGRTPAAGPTRPLGTPLAHGGIVPAARSAYQETGASTSPHI
jgi:hypothetical protein